MPVKYTQWILVTVVPCKAVDTLCYLNGGTVLLIILLPLLILFVVGYLYLKKTVKPLEQLVTAANDIVHGKLDTPMPTIEHNDEICQLRDAMEDIQGMLLHYTDKKRGN